MWVRAVALDAAAPAKYSEAELRGMFAGVAGGDDRAALTDVERTPYIAGLLDEGDITRAELAELFGRAPKALIADWQEVQDPSSGNPYFWNTRPSETTWERQRKRSRPYYLICDYLQSVRILWIADQFEHLSTTTTNSNYQLQLPTPTTNSDFFCLYSNDWGFQSLEYE